MAFQFDSTYSTVKTTLEKLGWYKPERHLLLLGTGATESDFGSFLKQIGGGPGLGFYQMENATFNDCWRYLGNKKILSTLIQSINSKYTADNYLLLQTDLVFATIMAAVKYYMIPAPIPSSNVNDLADYWKKYYNTKLGKGESADYVKKFNQYVQPGLKC